MSLERLVYSTVTEQYNSLRKIEDKAAGIVSNFTPFPPREVLGLLRGEQQIEDIVSKVGSTYDIPSETVKILLNNPSSDLTSLQNPQVQQFLLNVCPPKEDILKSTVTLNSLTQFFININKTVQRLEKIINISEITVDVLRGIILILKINPAPIPPGLPISATTIPADSLDVAKLKTDQAKNIIIIVESFLNQVSPLIQKISSILQQTASIVNLCMINLPEEDQQEFQLELTDTLNGIGNFSDPEVNKTINENTFPTTYKGFDLVLEFDPKNEFTFPARRIRGTNQQTNQVIFNTENGIYSFSSSVEVLFNEIKFRIDNL